LDFEQFSDPEVRDFLLENLSKEPGLLVLKNLSVSGIPAKDLAVQLNGLQKSQKKLPNWFNTAGIVFPAGISVEQCSSEITASHKASLISGETMVDLTGGFGVDSFYFSQKVTKLDYVETQNPLLEIAQYNHKLLKATNIAYSNTAAIDFLKTKPNHHYDWIYLDPARRDDAKNRVFFLEDCEPAVLEIIDLLFQKGNRILLKTSPLLDIHKAIIDLGNVSEVLVLAVENECKELLFVLEKNPKPTICKTVNFTKSGHQNFEFLIENESKAWAGFSEPQKYLYEPNAAILKSGAFKSVGGKFDLKKLHPSSICILLWI